MGFVSDRHYVFPCASSDESADGAWLHRLYLEAASRWQLPGAAPPAEAGKVFRSDTGELVIDLRSGVFTAVAPRVRIATGFMAEAGAISLGPVTVECKTPFASISLVSLDAKPVEESGRLLLTAVARAENTGQAYLRNHSSLPERGRPPILVEPVDAHIRVATGRLLQAYPLTSGGRKGPRLPTQRTAGALALRTRAARSPWILLVAD